MLFSRSFIRESLNDLIICSELSVDESSDIITSSSEVVIICYGEAFRGGNPTADASRTVVAGTCATVACLDAMLSVVPGQQSLVVVRFRIATVPHVADGHHPVGHQ